MLSKANQTVNHRRCSVFQLLVVSVVFFFFTLSSGLLFAFQAEIRFDASIDPRVIGHYLHYGQSTSFSNKVDLKNNTAYLISDLQEGSTYYFAATAYDIDGNESSFSEILSYQVPEQNQAADDNQDVTPDFVNDSLYLTEDFENHTAESDPPDWFDTRVGNSMAEDTNLFKVLTINNNNVFGTSSILPSIHSHHIKSYLKNFTSFEYSGRMMTTSENGGIGVTFLSHYPFTNKYYRLRSTENHSSFQLVNSHSSAGVSGITDTELIPKVNEWYRFRIMVENTGLKTEILAKVWPENASEPTQWQIDAYDDTSDRLVSGTFGVWSGHAGAKYWDDLNVTGY